MTENLAAINSFTPGDAVKRKALFTKMTDQATRYRHPDQLLQAQVVIIMCYDIKANAFCVTPKAMVKLLTLYDDYREPEGTETCRAAALKVTNKLISCLTDETFGLVLQRTAVLSLQLITQRTMPSGPAVLDLSDEEDVPLSVDTKFTSHKSVILDDKDGMREFLSLQSRIETLAKERSTIRAWEGSDAQTNKDTAVVVVKSYANKDVSQHDPDKVQQYLLKCFSHRIAELLLLQSKGSVPARPASSSPAVASPTKPAPVPDSPRVSATKTKYHSSGTVMPPPPESGLGEDHPYNDKVVNSSEV